MMLKVALCLLVLFVANAYSDKLKCRTAVPDFKLKQRMINHLVDFINKPIYPDFTSAYGILTQKEEMGLGRLSPDQPFSLFDERHWREAKKVIKLLLNARDFEEFVKIAELLHERVNDDLLLYGVSVVLLHRNDTQGLHVPPIHKIYPDKFLRASVIKEMKELSKQARLLDETPLIDATEDHDNNLDPNHDLTYFLEDLGLNSHHYHWHVMYPALWKGDDLDRKGELFYWMHKQMLTRYEIARMCNGLERVLPFENWNEPIEEGYNPHLVIDKLGYRFTYRPPHMVLRNLPNLSKVDLLQWKENIMYAIHRERVIAENGTVIPLNNDHGIEILGDIVEASALSVNKGTYGNIHNYAHVMAAKITDPYDQFGGNYGAMYDVATSARDPLFYSWHKFIDNIFQEHKNMLPPYTKEQIDFPNVKINKLTIKGDNTTEDNIVHTYWQDSVVKVPKGFTFTGETAMYVKVRHLQHENFKYEIEVENGGPEKTAVVRIYLAPEENELHQKLRPNEIRQLNVELDKFTVKLQPGKNVILRASDESTLTTPWSHIFKDRYKSEPMDHCHCGIPDYMLLPKGSYSGMPFYVAVHIADWEEDRVDQVENCHCPDYVNYCGDADRRYPDKRPLGFPFDRRVEGMWDTFATPNMIHQDIQIKFTGEVLAPKSYYYPHHKMNV